MPLLAAVAERVPNRGTFAAIARVVAISRAKIVTSSLEGWVDRLDAEGLRCAAAELACLVLTDPAAAPWPAERIDGWRAKINTLDYGRGVIAAASELLCEPERRARIAQLVAEWAYIFRTDDLGLLFDRYNEETLFADRHAVAILTALLPRVRDVSVEVARRIVSVLERFLASDAKLVLEYVDALLSCCLATQDGTAAFVVAECLALTFSLRLALPSQAARIHSLFERALAADLPVAQEALETVDGRLRAVWNWPRVAPRRRRVLRQRGGRFRTRRPGS